MVSKILSFFLLLLTIYLLQYITYDNSIVLVYICSRIFLLTFYAFHILETSTHVIEKNKHHYLSLGLKILLLYPEYTFFKKLKNLLETTHQGEWHAEKMQHSFWDTFTNKLSKLLQWLISSIRTSSKKESEKKKK